MIEDHKTAVLIHGCHLQADLNGKSWQTIAFGGTDGAVSLDGRVVMGIKTALDYGVDLIIFSTGASEIDGIKEGDYTRAYAFSHAEAIADTLGVPEEAILELLANRSLLDLESQNTGEECGRNFRLCADQRIDRVILVSSPWHIQRCYTEGLKTAETMREAGETVPDIIAVASYGSTEGTIILEPPHRGDQPKNRFAELGVRFFRIKPEKLRPFQEGLEKLLVLFGA